VVGTGAWEGLKKNVACGASQAVIRKVLFVGSDNFKVRVLISIPIRETDGMQESSTEFYHWFGTNNHARERSVSREIYLDMQADELLSEVRAENGTFYIGSGDLGRGSGLGKFR
jgi:hypothetical protein